MPEGFFASTVRRNTYLDSVTLLQVTSAASQLSGVLEAALVMGTELNRDVLRDSGLLVGEAAAAGANDLVIAVRAADAASAASGLAEAQTLLNRRQQHEHASSSHAPRSIRSATRLRADASLAVISVPGRYAAAEARQALAAGLHVFLFSDNVAIEDEIELKHRAREQGLLVMGPDCGTSILNGVGFGFANNVRRGRIGLIGASGTGLQEISSLLHRAGEGISHAIGTGGRDLHAEVGGITTLQAIELLREDDATHSLVLISKPAPSDVTQDVLRAAAATGKPVVACMLGAAHDGPAGVQMASNLHQAARLAAPDATWSGMAPESLPRPRVRFGSRQVRGLFCGGTLAEEAELALKGASVAHSVIDFGDDRFTRGRAHPMIDPSLRNHAILEAAADPEVAVLLLDVIIGFGAHADPAGALVPVVREAIERGLCVIAHVVGTDADAQDVGRQESALRAAGVHVFGSNHHAAVAAALVLEGAQA